MNTILATILFISMNAVTTLPDGVITDTKVNYNGVAYPALVTYLEVDPDFAKDAWKDHVKDEHDVRVKGYGFLTNKDVLYAEGEQFEGLSEKRANVYSRITEAEDGKTRIEVFMSLGYDVKVGPNNYDTIYENLEASMKSYVEATRSAYFDERKEAAVKSLAVAERKLHKTKKKLEKLREDKMEVAEDIRDNEAEIEKMKEEEENLAKEIEETEGKKQTIQESVKEHTENVKEWTERTENL